MAIILKGIDLPTSGQIELIIRPHGKVLSKTKGISAEAIQIPKDHGRLIDGGALYKFFEDALDKNPLDDWWEAGGVLDNIELAPTILDKEKE